MAKKTSSSSRPGAPNARQAKAQAAAAATSGGPNKIIIATVVAVLAIVAVVGGVVWNDISRKNAITQGGTAVPAGTAMSQGLNIAPTATLVAGAPTLDIYEDFQCPACKNFEDQLGDTVVKLAQEGKAKVVLHVKNFLDGNLRNDSSTRAAVAAFCAADAGKFLEYHKLVYANQPATEGTGWTDAQLKGFAEQAGVTGAALDTWAECTKAEKYKTYVNSVEEQSTKDGVKSTPTLRLNGTDMDRAKITSPETFEQLVVAATAK